MIDLLRLGLLFTIPVFPKISCLNAPTYVHTTKPSGALAHPLRHQHNDTYIPTRVRFSRLAGRTGLQRRLRKFRDRE